MSDIIESARKLVTERPAAIEAEAGQLERALMGVGEGNGSALASAKPRRKRAPGKRQRPQAPRGQRRAAPRRDRDYARRSTLRTRRRDRHRPGQVSALLAKARAEKLIVKKGRRLRAEAVGRRPPLGAGAKVYISGRYRA